MVTPSEQFVEQVHFERERAELEAVIAASLRPTSNMARLLRYICEMRFADQVHEIKEYSIAVEALHRPASFDPARDSIVRVEAHRLRSRLERFYQQGGASHRVRIVIPTGSYVPQFEYPDFPSEAPSVPVEETFPPVFEPEAQSPADVVAPSQLPGRAVDGGARVAWISLAALLLVAAFAIAYRQLHTHSAVSFASSRAVGSQVPADRSPEVVRIVAGVNSPSFTDTLGTSWMGDRYFTGGSAESVSPRAIAFAQDPSLFLHRRRGDFSYTIPLRPGTYELRLYFADVFFGENNPDGGGEGSRVFNILANGHVLIQNLDVISDAGGSNTADIKIFEGIQPDASGNLHLNFIAKRNVPFVNAIELLPTPQGVAVPLRMAMQRTGYTDAAGKWWEPDHFFRGGVSLESNAEVSTKEAGRSSMDGERYGNFVYTVPVALTRVYRATFTFKEIDDKHVLGESTQDKDNVFSIAVNTRPLLEDLHISPAGEKGEPVQRSFRGLAPNAQGKLIFSFVPSHNYAVVNSIEVTEDK